MKQPDKFFLCIYIFVTFAQAASTYSLCNWGKLTLSNHGIVGKVQDSILWKDKKGKHVSLVTQKYIGIIHGKDSTFEIRAYVYTIGKSWQKEWEYIEPSDSMAHVNYYQGSLSLSDFDKDSLAETRLMVEILPDGVEETIKYVLYDRSGYFRIDCAIPLGLSIDTETGAADSTQDYTKSVKVLFGDIPKEILSAAVSNCDSIVHSICDYCWFGKYGSPPFSNKK